MEDKEVEENPSLWRFLSARQVLSLYPKSRAESLSLGMQEVERNDSKMDKGLCIRNILS